MKSFRPILIAICIIVLLHFNISLSETNNGLRIKFSTENEVRVQKAGSEGWLDINPNYELLSGDKISTLEESSALINIYMHLSLQLGPFSLVEFTADSSANMIFIKQGSTILMASQSSRNIISIRTPVSILEFVSCQSDIMVGNDGSTEIKVFTGEINLTTVPNYDTTQTDSTAITQSIEEPVNLVINRNEKIVITSWGTIVFHDEFIPDKEYDEFIHY